MSRESAATAGSYSFTRSYFVGNCLRDAFKTAFETLLDRRDRYGSGSAELSRWIEAQIAVFDQCSGEVAFEPSGGSRSRLAALGTA